MDRLMEGTVCICDVCEKPISFVVEIMGTTDYVYYNARFFRVRYVCNNLPALERAAMDMEVMKSRLDLELHRTMEEMAKDTKKSTTYKINFNSSYS
jgi:hypothetical protein